MDSNSKPKIGNSEVEGFLEKHCHDDILKLASSYPDEKSLYLDYEKASKTNIELADLLISDPEKTILKLEEALHTYPLPVELTLDKAHVRIKNLPEEERIAIRALRAEHTGKLVAIAGIVQKATEVRPVLVRGAFKCMRCEHVNFLEQPEWRFVEPFQCENDTCGRRGPFKLLEDQSEYLDSQKIRVQELPEELKGGEKSQSLDIILNDDLVDLVLPGNRVLVIGVLKMRQITSKSGAKTPSFDIYLLSNNIELQEEHREISLTSMEEKRLRELASSKDVADRIVESFCTTVHGMREIKEAILCSAVSNGLGHRGDGTPQRDHSHVLICGDPGTAKSNLLLALKALVPKTQYSTGEGSTKAGLTAAAIKDDFGNGRWSIEAGTLALADQGIACIDELDKMTREQTSQLNTALSNCIIPIDKAGIKTTLWSRCSVIASMNPRYGKFDAYELLTDQVAVAPHTLSRFDLIFLILDKPEPERDKEISSYIINAWTDALPGKAPAIDFETLKKYIHLAKTLKPRYSEEVLFALQRYYLAARAKSTERRVSITPRHMEALLRISKAEAQLHLSNTVTIEHAKRAIRLLEASILQVGIDEKGYWDAYRVEIGVGESQRDKLRTLREIIEELQRENKGIAKIEDLFLKGEEKGLNQKEIASMLRHLKERGEIWAPRDGLIKLT